MVGCAGWGAHPGAYAPRFHPHTPRAPAKELAEAFKNAREATQWGQAALRANSLSLRLKQRGQPDALSGAAPHCFSCFHPVT